MPSFMPAKNDDTLASVPIMVRSFPTESRSMLYPSFSSGFRNGSASMYPVVGKDSSNITIRRISSVSRSLWRMMPGSVENCSDATRSAA